MSTVHNNVQTLAPERTDQQARTLVVEVRIATYGSIEQAAQTAAVAVHAVETAFHRRLTARWRDVAKHKRWREVERERIRD